MGFTVRKTALTVAAFTGLAAFPALADEASFTDAQKEAIGPLIKEYLMENPNVIFEAIEAQRMQQEAEMREKAEASISSNMAFFNPRRCAFGW